MAKVQIVAVTRRFTCVKLVHEVLKALSLTMLQRKMSGNVGSGERAYQLREPPHRIHEPDIFSTLVLLSYNAEGFHRAEIK